MLGVKPAVLLSVLALAACAADPFLYRVDVEMLDAPGGSGNSQIEATRDRNGWTVKHTTSWRSSTRRLGPAATARLDAALASGALYAPPADIPDGCLDPGLLTLEISAEGVTRRIVLECQQSPGVKAVLDVLYD